MRLTVETASELEAFCAERALAYANERDHLARCCKAVAARIVAELPPPRPALSPFGFGERHEWIGLGGVDVVFRWEAREPTFVELKSGSGTGALRPCVWDAVKLATAVLGGNASSGYMLAAAPVSAWRTGYLGAELFESGEWLTLGPEIRDRFRGDWSFWASEATPHVPGRVPAGIRTIAVGSASLSIASTLWELRAARVEPIGTDWVKWPGTV